MRKSTGILLIAGLALLTGTSSMAKADDANSFAINFLKFSGERDKSLVDSYGFAADFTASNSDGVLRLIYGADFQYAKARSYINSVARSATYYGSDFKVGFQIVPAQGELRPFIEVVGLAGIKSLGFDNNQTTLPRESIGMSRGFRVGVGVELEFFSNKALRLAAYYVENRAVKLAGQNDYNLGSLTASLGISF